MTTTTLGLDHVGLATELINLLEKERDPVRRQVAIELVIMNHVMRMRDEDLSIAVANGINKHVLQLVRQAYREGILDHE